MQALIHLLILRLARVPVPLILSLLYAALIGLGAAALMLPWAQRASFDWSDALFTAASAVTVTGLGVIDVQGQLTHFGQVVVMVLIQLGGLGLMTFAVLILGALGLPVGITGHIYLREELNQTSVHQITRLLRTILKVMLICQGAGAMLLALSFVPRSGLLQGLWEAVFHAVSAFNNAGMSTFPTGLVPFATDPVVNAVIPALILLGGIGYAVLHDVVTRRGWRSWSLHTKIMLLGSAVLIPWSVILFAVLEWNNPGTLGPHGSIAAKLGISWFQGITPRTAGFNTIDMAAMRDSTTMMYITLMLIGGGPTSTAGGLKVTTFVVLILATIAFFRRHSEPHLFGRSIGLEQVFKVMALTALSLIIVLTGIFALTIVQPDGHFLDIAFEVASAFGTVGLTRGYTDDLTEPGRAIIIALMFLGRLGPLTLGFFLATRAAPRVRYPEGTIHLG